ncbi:MAG TPA: SsgA family sporulation/cell division regulator [Jiangellales bacterium]|nr:SsgA family sporulation/cell division regulator [Jiangellales bacterium]
MDVPSTVTHELSLHLLSADGPALPLEAQLRYRASDPLAVEALFDAGSAEPVRWVFSRDLLVAGLDQRAGEGDVVVWPGLDPSGRAVTHLSLSSPDGAALLEAPVEAVRSFLGDTFRVVPLGAEGAHLDLDAELDELLGRR